MNDASNYLLRCLIRIKLEEFDFKIREKYKTSKTNNNADALNRIKKRLFVNTNRSFGEFLGNFNSN